MKVRDMYKRYWEAPERTDTTEAKTLFLGGGITGCPEWQFPVSQRLLDETNLTLYNPRRKNWTFGDSETDDWTQIRWEFRHLAKSNMIMFWFPEETLCPIVLFELGKFIMVPDKELFVGVHPNYPRKRDVYIQLELERPDIIISDNLEHMVDDIIESVDTNPTSF